MKNRWLLAACAILIAGLLGLTGSTYSSEMTVMSAGPDPLNLERGTIVSNVSFLGESLSGYSLSGALTRVNGYLKNIQLTKFRLQSQEDESHVVDLHAEDFDLTFDETVAERALSDKILEGNLLERYKMAKDYQLAPFEVRESISYNLEKVEAFLKEHTDAWTQQPIDASVSGLSGRLVVTPGQNGRSYDYSEALGQLKADLDALTINETVYVLPVQENVTEPALTTERAKTFTIIGSCTTEYPAKRNELLVNREHNLQKSLDYLNGRRYAPGEVISVNDIYGNGDKHNRLDKLGYLPAGTYFDGGHSAAYGGGICQTTTTIYNAVLKAELEVVYRMHHRYLIPYVQASFDAMVSYPDYDFLFRNSSSDYIFLEGYLDVPAETMTIYIIGHEDHPSSHTVRYESEILSHELPSIRIVENPEWPVGFTTGNRKFYLNGDGPSAGITSRLWKITYENGVEVSREIVTSAAGTVDNYLPGSAEYIVCPDTTVTITYDNNYKMNYIRPYVHFLDGTTIGVNPIKWSDDEKAAFNERMTALCAAKGYVWPDTGNVITVDGEQIWPNPLITTEPLPETSSSDTPGTTGSEAQPTEPPTQSTEASTQPPTEPPTEPPAEEPPAEGSGEGSLGQP